MAMPFLVLTGIMTVLTAPGLITNYLKDRRERTAVTTEKGELNA